MNKDCKNCKYGRKVRGNPLGPITNGFETPFIKCTNSLEATPDYMYGGWCPEYLKND